MEEIQGALLVSEFPVDEIAIAIPGLNLVTGYRQKIAAMVFPIVKDEIQSFSDGNEIKRSTVERKNHDALYSSGYRFIQGSKKTLNFVLGRTENRVCKFPPLAG